MRVFTYMWSILFMLNAGLVVSVTWLALTGWNQGTLTAAAVATAIPFALQIMNMSRLDPRDRLQHLPPDRHGAGLDGRPSPSR